MTRTNDWNAIAKQRREAETHPHLKKTFIPKERIERRCLEALDEQGLLPAEPGPVRIDRLLEKRWGIVEEYLDMPPGVLGAAAFDRDGLRRVAISREFDDPGEHVAEKRGRATLAHEIGHGLLHEELWQDYFRDTGQLDMFSAGAGRAREGTLVQMCRDEIINAFNYEHSLFQWWEFQANLAMGFLLVPSPLLSRAMRRYRSDLIGPPETEIAGLESVRSYQAWFAVEDLAREFNVSKALMRHRLRGLPDIADYRIRV